MSNEIIDYIENNISVRDYKNAKVWDSPKLKLNVLQRYAIKRISKNNQTILCHSRQVGVDTTLIALCIYYMNNYKDINICYLDRTNESCSNFMKRLYETIDNMCSSDKPKFNFKQKQYLLTENGVSIKCQSVSQSNPMGIFRGVTPNIFIVNNAAFIPKISEAMVGVMPVLTKVRDVTKNTDIPFKIIICSTLNKEKKNWFRKLWKKALLHKNIFDAVYMHYDYLDDDKYKEEEFKQVLSYDEELINKELECKL